MEVPKNRTHWLFWATIIAFIAMIVIPTACDAQIPKDKVDHFMSGVLIGTTSTFLTINQPARTSLYVTLGSVAVIGGGKELIWDGLLNKGVASWSDFGADVIGSLAGWGFISGLKLISKPKNNYTGIVFGNTEINMSERMSYSGVRFNCDSTY